MKKRPPTDPQPGERDSTIAPDPGAAGRGAIAPEGTEPAGDLGPETAVGSRGAAERAGIERSGETGAPEPLLAELERLRAREDELLRAIAEQQNVMKRRRQDMEASIQYAQESLVRELLPVLDDLERAVDAMKGTVDEPIRTGVLLVQDRLLRTLQAQGLEPIRPLGDRFDPEVHDALAQRAEPGAAPGTVLDVALPGYRFRGRVLRHAKVVVAGPADTGETAALRSATP